MSVSRTLEQDDLPHRQDVVIRAASVLNKDAEPAISSAYGSHLEQPDTHSDRTLYSEEAEDAPAGHELVASAMDSSRNLCYLIVFVFAIGCLMTWANHITIDSTAVLETGVSFKFNSGEMEILDDFPVCEQKEPSTLWRLCCATLVFFLGYTWAVVVMDPHHPLRSALLASM